MSEFEAEVTSEFAAVRISVDHAGNGPRLRIEDLKTGRVGYLDALELETLAWLPEGGLHKLLDPSLVRWRDPQSCTAGAGLVRRIIRPATSVAPTPRSGRRRRGYRAVKMIGAPRTLGHGWRFARGRAAFVLALVLPVASLGPAAGTATASSANKSSFAWSAPRLVDTATRFDHPAVLSGLSCPSTTLCVGVGSYGSLETSTNPSVPSGWNGATIDSGALESVSCPSTSFCAAVASAGDLLTSTNPTGGAEAWNPVSNLLGNPQTGLGGISCPTVSLCVAVNGNSDIFTSTNPAGGPAAWNKRTSPGFHQLDGVSCPTVSLCVVVDFDGQIVTSTNPTGNASAWTDITPTFGGSVLLSVSCQSASLCVATDDAGEVVVSQDPAGGAQTWKAIIVDSPNTITSVSCAAGGPCVAGDSNGNLIASSHPSGGAQAWELAKGVDPSGFGSIACQSGSLCLAGDTQGSVAVSTAPTAPAPGWMLSPQLGGGPVQHPGLTGVSCPSPSLCVAADGAGDAISTTRPTGQATTWKVTDINPGFSISGISCPSIRFCATVGRDYVATTTQPTGGPPAWTLADLELFSPDNNGVTQIDSLTAIGCAPNTLCVAPRFASNYNLEVSRHPLQGASTWQAEAVGQYEYDFFRTVSCPSKSLCVAADAQGGTVAVSTNGAQDWKFTYVEAKSAMNGSLTPAVVDVSCPTNSFCAAVDDVGNVITTHDPAGRAKGWHRARPEGHHELASISCASASFCAVLDRRGNVLLSNRPTGGARSWRRAMVGKGLTGLSCPSARLCVISTESGAVIVGQGRG
jgi:hypothetical protein